MRAFFIGILLLVSLGARAEFAIVVGKNSPVDQLDKRVVADIFLAKSNRLPNGQRIKTLELDDDTLKAAFYEKISGKSLAQINSYWTTLIFTGKGRPPKTYATRESLLDMLRHDPYTISFLPIEQVNDSLKVVCLFR